MMTMDVRGRIGLGILALGLATGGCTRPPEFKGTPVPDHPAARLVGTNWNGETFDLDQVTGKITLVFFGYTYCPDVCPFTLSKAQQLFRSLGEQAEQVAVVFASVDPHRDSVEKLAKYVPNFDRRFYGLHLTFDEIDIARESFGLTIQYGQPKDGPGTDSFYYVDHTGTFFLLDGQGRLQLTYPPNVEVADIEADVRRLLGGS